MSFSKVCPCFTLPANHRQQIVYLAMPHTETNKSQATNHTSCHASHRYHQITGNKSYILPCLTQMPTNNRQQFVHLAMPHTDTSESSVKGKSSRGYDLLRAITGNKSYILSCLAQIPPNHKQQILHLAMPHTDASKSNVKRKSSRGYDLLWALGPASCDITHEAGDTSCDITHEPRARFVVMLTVCWTTKKQYVCDSFLTLKTVQLSKQDEFLPDLSIFDLKNLGF